MYEEYLGKGYHDEIRKMLLVRDDVLPNSVIDADVNIGAMRMIVGEELKKKQNLKDYALVQKAAKHCLCSILCMALKSRAKNPAFKFYRGRNWRKKQEKQMIKYYRLLGLMR